MKTSVIGTGRMGQGLVKVLQGNVPNLKWGSRRKEKAEVLIRDNGYETAVTPASIDEALNSDIIIHSLWFRDLLPWAEEHRSRLAGKIVVDIVNPFTEDFSDFTTDWDTSAAETLQALLPETRVIGAFKNTFFRVFDNPVHEGLRSDVYVTGDDAAAKAAVLELLRTIPFRVLDGGALKNNRTIERMTLFERELAIRYGTYPYVAFRLFGLPADSR
jgi:NADPH-dependent F420 reductase